jgi:hypothetical protein
VSKFYIYDNNSTLPAMLMLWDYVQEGLVEYQYFLGTACTASYVLPVATVYFLLPVAATTLCEHLY